MIDPLYPDLAFYGAPAVGKTAACKFLEGLGFVRVSFAGWHPGGLRDVVSRIYGVEDGFDAANDRLTLNRVGMGGREIDEDFWVRPMLREARRARANGQPVVNDDMRGENEWTQLGAAGFVRVHLVAPPEVREERLRRSGRLEGSDAEFLYRLEDPERYHPDYVIDTSGPKEELERAVIDILNLERSKRA